MRYIRPKTATSSGLRDRTGSGAILIGLPRVYYQPALTALPMPPGPGIWNLPGLLGLFDQCTSSVGGYGYNNLSSQRGLFGSGQKDDGT